MSERPDFQQKQYAFAAHIRDPQNAPAPEGIEDRRMAIYRKLFFNNIRNLLGNMFPVLKKVHTAERWNYLIRQFMKQHRAVTPYFLELPQEFIDFLQDEYELEQDDFPFLVELAHYEYVELALSISEEENDLDGVDPDGDLLDGVPVKSVLADVYAYRYPVHRISAEFKPEASSGDPTYLAVYRGNDDEVGFLELNAVTAGLLNAIAENQSGLTGAELLHNLAAALDYPDDRAFAAHGAAALNELRAKEVLLGTRRRTDPAIAAALPADA